MLHILLTVVLYAVIKTDNRPIMVKNNPRTFLIFGLTKYIQYNYVYLCFLDTKVNIKHFFSIIQMGEIRF